MHDDVFYFDTADDFRAKCEDQFRCFAEEHQWNYPAAELSHVCVRTKNLHHLEKILDFSEQLGRVTVNYKDTDVDKLQPIWFVELDKPLLDGELHAPYLAVTLPKPEMNFTTVQLVVGTDNRINHCDHFDVCSYLDEKVLLKCQKNSAATILKLAL